MSSFRDRMKKKRKALRSRHNESVKRRDEGDKTSWSSIFNKEEIEKREVIFWRPKKGEHIIDVIPFEAGLNHPDLDKGEIGYVVEIEIYRNIGPLNKDFVSPAKVWGEIDPISEFIEEQGGYIEDKKVWNKIRTWDRTIYFIWDHSSVEEEEKGIQVWDVSSFFFAEKVDDQAKIPKGGGSIVWSDWETGKSICFDIKASGTYDRPDGSKGESIEYSGHKFLDRDEVIPDHILDSTFPLDDLIIMRPTYKDIAEHLHGKKSEKEDIQEEVQEDTPEDVKEDIKKEKESKEECPAGGDFGIDTLDYPECDECPIYDDCYALKQGVSADKKDETPDKEPDKKSDKEPETGKKKRRRRNR